MQFFQLDTVCIFTITKVIKSTCAMDKFRTNFTKQK